MALLRGKEGPCVVMDRQPPTKHPRRAVGATGEAYGATHASFSYPADCVTVD